MNDSIIDGTLAIAIQKSNRYLYVENAPPTVTLFDIT
jgi:hypothetical protein